MKPYFQKEFRIKERPGIGAEELKDFIRVQEGESNLYVCTICEKSFRALSGIKNHMARHAGTEKYRCLICQKSFVQLHHFTGHMALHDPTRMVKCRFCLKPFAYKTNCHRHEKNCKGPDGMGNHFSCNISPF